VFGTTGVYTTNDKILGLITFTKEVKVLNANTLLYPEINNTITNFMAFNDEIWDFKNAILKFHRKAGTRIYIS